MLISKIQVLKTECLKNEKFRVLHVYGSKMKGKSDAENIISTNINIINYNNNYINYNPIQKNIITITLLLY